MADPAAPPRTMAPAAFPRPWSRPRRDVVRRQRLLAEDGCLVFVGESGVRSWTAGPDGEIVDAVVADHRWFAEQGIPGLLQLRSRPGDVVASVPLALWTPDVDDRPMGLDHLLAASGLGDVLQQLGVPVRTSRSGGRAGERDVPDLGTVLAPIGADPSQMWFQPRLLALALVAIALVGTILSGDARVSWLLAATVVLAALVDQGPRWLASRRERLSALSGVLAELTPNPAVAVPRGFLRSRVRVTPDAIVLENAHGQERWLPRHGTHGVTALALVGEGVGEEGAATVEFRTSRDHARAVLQYVEWFGHGGRAQLEDFAARAGLVLTTRPRPPSRPAAPTAFAATAAAAPLPVALIGTRPSNTYQIAALAGLAVIVNLSPPVGNPGPAVLAGVVAFWMLAVILVETGRRSRERRLVQPVGTNSA